MESRTVTIDKLELLMDTVEITAASPSDIAVYHDAGAMQLPEARCGATLCVFCISGTIFFARAILVVRSFVCSTVGNDNPVMRLR